MNRTRVKCLLVMMALSVIGFGPLSLTCLIGFYVVAARPRWFYHVVQDLYRHHADAPPTVPSPPCSRVDAATARAKCFLCLIMLLILSIAPVPVTGPIGLYVVIMRPRWFKTLVERIYCDAQERIP